MEFGIYLNSKENRVARVNSPYWVPQGPDWVLVTDEVNATLLQVRELARKKRFSKEPDKLQWV